MTSHLILDGVGVFITKVLRYRFGNTLGYKVYVEYDGMAQPPFEDYIELELMLEAANHAKPNRQFGAYTDMNNIKAILEAHGNTYRVGAIIASNGDKVTRQQVLDEQKAKREARTTTNLHKSYVDSGMSIADQIGATQARLKAEREAKERARIAELEAKHAIHFGEASKAIMAWFLDKPYTPESVAA